jgi:hypothetical protein
LGRSDLFPFIDMLGLAPGAGEEIVGRVDLAWNGVKCAPDGAELCHSNGVGVFAATTADGVITAEAMDDIGPAGAGNGQGAECIR